MVEVLRRGTRHRITCPSCDSLLAYWEKDIEYKADYQLENPRYIECPVCGADITVPPEIEANGNDDT